MNSILQCLFASPKLNEYFMGEKYLNEINTKSKTKGKLVKAYAELVSKAKDGSVSRMVVSDFKSIVGRCNSAF